MISLAKRLFSDFDRNGSPPSKLWLVFLLKALSKLEFMTHFKTVAALDCVLFYVEEELVEKECHSRQLVVRLVETVCPGQQERKGNQTSNR